MQKRSEASSITHSHLCHMSHRLEVLRLLICRRYHGCQSSFYGLDRQIGRVPSFLPPYPCNRHPPLQPSLPPLQHQIPPDEKPTKSNSNPEHPFRCTTPLRRPFQLLVPPPH